MGLRNMIIEFTLTDKDDLKRVTSRFHEKGFIVVSYEMTESASVNGEIYQVSMTVKAKHMNEEALLLMFLNEFPG